MGSDDKVKALLQNFWEWRMQTSPEFATFCGFHAYDDRLESYDFESINQKQVKVAAFLEDAENLAQSSDVADKLKEDLNFLITDLKVYLKGFKAKGYYYPLNYLEGPHTEFERLISAMKCDTLKDYEKILSRFAAFPIQISQIIEVLKKAVEENLVFHLASVLSVPEQLELLDQTDVISKNPEECVFYKPFLSLPESIPEDRKNSLLREAVESISTNVYPTFRKLKDYLKKEYIKEARDTPGISSVPNGSDYYQLCLDFHLGFHMSAADIHSTGLSEVKRISGEIEKVMVSLGYDKLPLKDYTKLLRNDPRFHFENSEEILLHYEDLVFNKIKPKLEKIFEKIPKDKLKIEAFPSTMANAPLAYYLAGTPDGARSGVFYANVKDVKSVLKYQMMALALHEALPGHHLQQSYMFGIEDIAEFRKYTEDRKYSEVPSRFPLHSAYIEGWGLYSEFLGIELGLYEDKFDYFGYLSQEILRAVRLVVDTGLHAFNWSQERAVTYMEENTASSLKDIENEVKRYITWPGQACAYKLGEMKIKSLREIAEKKLGSQFNLRDFHDIVLHYCGPLDIVEKELLQYVDEHKR